MSKFDILNVNFRLIFNQEELKHVSFYHPVLQPLHKRKNETLNVSFTCYVRKSLYI